MYFALGFLVAGLITLLFLPAFWRRALRLSMRRLQMLTPMSMEEVVAERDLLRAEFAVRERRLEQEIDSVKAARAGDLVSLGREAARVADFDTRLKQSEAARRDMESLLRDAERTVAERTDLLSSTEMALHEMTERAERGLERLRLLESDKEALGRETQAQSSRVAAHEAKIGAMHEHNAKMQRALDDLREDFARVSEEAAQMPSLQREMARIGDELETTRNDRQTLLAQRDELIAQFRAAQERHANEIDRLENAVRTARGESRDLANRLEIARADNAMLSGALEALRQERAQARAGASGEEGEIAALREAIIDFGARATAATEAEKAKESASA